MIVKSGSESSLSEACDSLKESSKRFEAERDDCSDDDGGDDDDKHRARTATKPTAAAAATDKLDIPQQSLMIKRGSLTSAKSLHEFKHETSKAATPTPTTTGVTQSGSKNGQTVGSGGVSAGATGAKNHSDDECTTKRGIRPSKSDTSLTESFVIVDAAGDYGRRRNANSLRDGG